MLVPVPDEPVARRAAAAANDRAVHDRFGRPAPAVWTTEATIPVPGHPSVRVRVYAPTAAEPAAGRSIPVLLYCYGGGFTLAGIDWAGWDGHFRRLAADAGVLVVAPDYAHAPEVAFPAQPEQCWRAFEWAAEHAVEFGGDPDRLAVGGASSGGNLAAAVTLLNRRRGRRPIRLQVLEQPALDLTMGHVRTRGLTADIPGAILRAAGRRLVRDYVGRARGAARDPLASPLLEPDLSGLPPALVCTSELDPLSGDGEAYVRALTEAGVPAVGVRTIGATHESSGLVGVVASADQQHRAVVASLRAFLAPEALVYPAPDVP